MATFVLVHGSWQGAWCWREVIPRLNALGHQAIAPDLPGHGEDSTAPDEIALDDYVGALTRAISHADDRPIVVGHSFGGAFAREAAASIPEQVRAIAYVASVLPQAGRTLLDDLVAVDPEYLRHITWSPDRTVAELQPEGARRFLYPMAPPVIVEEAVRLLRPEPVAPCQTALRTKSERPGGIPSYYIECLNDSVVPLPVQRKMYENAQVSKVFSIGCDHSPFFSAPGDLVACLNLIAVDTAPQT